VILWLLAALGFLQPPMETYSLQAVVSDSNGAPVRNLELADVSLTAGGATLSLGRFEPDDRPARVALLIDSSMPMATVYRAEFIDAARAFLASLPSSTHVAVWTTGDRPVKVIDDLDLNREGSARELVDSLTRVPALGGNTILDAVVEAAEDLEKKEGERKIVVFLSGQGPGFSNDSRQGIVDRVIKTGVEVTGVLASERGESAEGGDVSQVDYDHVFGELTRRSGGRLERPLTAMGASSLFARVAADLRWTYRLSFQFRGAKIPRLALQVARPSVKVRLSTPRKETSSR
jgi:hypothetical protein